jgi:hypothetical protein
MGVRGVFPSIAGAISGVAKAGVEPSNLCVGLLLLDRKISSRCRRCIFGGSGCLPNLTWTASASRLNIMAGQEAHPSRSCLRLKRKSVRV